MYYKLKCDPATTADQYDCGEWDYLTYNTLYDHEGKLDSTRQTGTNYTINNAAPDSTAFAWTQGYEAWREYQHFITHNSTISFDSALFNAGSNQLAHPFGTAEKSGRAQYMWRATELTTAGLNAGNISGLRLNFGGLGGDVRNLRIKMAQTTVDTVSPDHVLGGFQEVYYYSPVFASTGWHDLQFTTPFNWNGTDNIVVEFSFTRQTTANNNMVMGETTAWKSGKYTTGNEYCLNFEGGQYVNLGQEPQSIGNAPRTIEAWAYTRSFNNAGIWQAGPTGTIGKDFSLRTRSSDNDWRVQIWGNPDFDANLPGSKEAWHHYAVTYDGSINRLYYDGQFIAQENANMTTDPFDIRIGRWQGSHFDGRIDEVRFWDAALPESVLRDWMNKDVTATHPNIANLQGDYTFNEGNGTSASDASANNNTPGTLLGIPWWEQIQGEEMWRNFTQSFERPNIVFEQGVYTSTLDSTAFVDSLPKQPTQVVLYENPA
ncbi:MAG: LamG domain-containing protein, partial [Bacteroidota bacterium]